MGFWSPSTLVYDAMRQGISVLPPDINDSAADCAVQDGAIRIGLGYVKGLKSHRLDPLLAERARAPFADLADFIRTGQAAPAADRAPDPSRRAGPLASARAINCSGMPACCTKRAGACPWARRCRRRICPSRPLWSG